MGTFDKLLGMAQKALHQQSGSRSTGPAPSRSTGSDWRSMVRTAADALTGDSRGTGPGAGTPGAGRPSGTAPTSAAALSEEDRRAIARYDYLVRTADPDQLEQVHREAFERLSPQQRAQVQARMREELPPAERPRSDSSADLARSATRLGALDPRRLTSLLARSGTPRAGGRAGGIGRGAAIGAAGAAGGMLAAVAGGAVLTRIGGSLLADAVGQGIDVDALVPDLALDLGELGALGDVDLGSLADLSANDVMDGAAGLGDMSLNDLGNVDLGDIGGLFGR